MHFASERKTRALVSTLVKLARKGDLISSSVSENGADWMQLAEQTMPMVPSAYIGLALTAHNNGASCTATFDHVLIAPRRLGSKVSVFDFLAFLPPRPSAG